MGTCGVKRASIFVTRLCDLSVVIDGFEKATTPTEGKIEFDNTVDQYDETLRTKYVVQYTYRLLQKG